MCACVLWGNRCELSAPPNIKIIYIKTTKIRTRTRTRTMKISASIIALIAFVAIFMTVLTEARLGRRLGRAEECSRLGNLARKYGLRVGTANYECMVSDSALNRLRSTIKYAERRRGLNPNGDEVGFRRWGGPSYSGNPNGDESVGRPSYTQGNGRTYRSNGYTMNSRGYLANPTRSAQIKARNAGALTNSEARSMGLKNYRDEIANDESVGWYMKNGRRYPQKKRTYSGSGMGDEMEDESVGYDRPSHTQAHSPNGQSVSNYYNNWRL